MSKQDDFLSMVEKYEKVTEENQELRMKLNNLEVQFFQLKSDVNRMKIEFKNAMSVAGGNMVSASNRM